MRHWSRPFLSLCHRGCLRRMFTATQAIIDATDDWGDPLRQELSGLPRPRGALRMVPPV